MTFSTRSEALRVIIRIGLGKFMTLFAKFHKIRGTEVPHNP